MNEDGKKLELLLSDLPDDPSADDYRAAAKQLLPYLQAHVPPMGEGRTLARLSFLTAVARRDLSLARLIEGHLDAIQILREAKQTAVSDSLYAIWASAGPTDSLKIRQNESNDDDAQLIGSKPFCSGSDIVDRALIYVYPSEQLVDVDMRAGDAPNRLVFESGQWKSHGFSETHTWTITFGGLSISPKHYIGKRKWYFSRPGFSLGALAPAACWAGGALALVDSLRQKPLRGGHALAHLGAMVASVRSMQAMLKWGAEQIDADPANSSGSLFPAALMVRHHIERGCTEIVDRFGRTLGPRPYAFDAVNARRISELNLYIRQCHAERDLEELGTYLQEHLEFPQGW